MTSEPTRPAAVVHPGVRRHCFTLTEVLFASAISVVVGSMLISFVIMSQQRARASQEQLTFNAKARYGTQQLTRLIQNARIAVPSVDGLSAVVVNPDQTVFRLYYADADGDRETVEDNSIWCDPDLNVEDDEYQVIRYVTPLDGEPVFAALGGGLAVRFHVGDSDPVSRSDHLTGPGYQGIAIRIVAQPRNIGQIWTSED